MRRDEALALVGQRVKVWTAANGRYTGTLKSIAGSPWRGTVEIDGVLEVAQHYERGAPVRRGKRPGELIEVGNSSVNPLAVDTAGIFSDYLSALRVAQAGAAERAVKPSTSPSHWVNAAFARALKTAIQAELERLRGEEWKLGPLAETAEVAPAEWFEPSASAPGGPARASEQSAMAGAVDDADDGDGETRPEAHTERP